ncbi:unnamed protein product [Cochlearia groenlandica]
MLARLSTRKPCIGSAGSPPVGRTKEMGSIPYQWTGKCERALSTTRRTRIRFMLPVSPKKKNRTFGLGSMDTVLTVSLSHPHRTPQVHAEENVWLRQQIDDQDRRYQNIIDFFSIITMESPNLPRLMQSRGVKPTQPPVILREVAEAATHELGRDLGIEDFEPLKSSQTTSK